MNTFRTISRVLVVATVAFVGSASATAGEYAGMAYDKANAAKFRFIAVHAADNTFGKKEHAKRAAVETLGFAVDRAGDKGFNITAIDQELAKHFAANYAFRVVGDQLGQRGVTIDLVARKGSDLTGGNVSESTVKTVAEYATNPEVLMVLASFIASYFPGSSTGAGSNK